LKTLCVEKHCFDECPLIGLRFARLDFLNDASAIGEGIRFDA
jgi:hypothetical protein